MRLRSAVRTDIGRHRLTNEDSFCARDDLGLFVVADGMGGHAAGEIASRVAVEAVERLVAVTDTVGVDDEGQYPLDRTLGRNANRLNASFVAANQSIASQIDKNPVLQGMGTTAVAVLGRDSPVALAHIGDSRAYLCRDANLTRLTRDHSWVEEQVRAGKLSVEDAREHPGRNIVTRALTGGTNLDVEVSEVKLNTGDRVLLCSDGLTSVCSDSEIKDVLNSGLVLDAICDRLVFHANDQGGPDNITVVVFEIDAV